MKCGAIMELSGKNVLITGGALGMGRSLAGLFLKEGAKVAIVDIRASDLEKALAELSALGSVQAFVCDVSDRQQVYAMADKVKREFGSIDILVNNAGIVRSDAFMDKPDEALEKVVAVNLLALCWTTKAFLPGMMAKGAGMVVNVASAGGLLGVPFISDYCATKFAVVGLTESLRQEMRLTGHKNIKFSYVCPNTVNTGMFAGAQAVKGTKMLTPEDVTTQIIAGIKKGKAMIGVPGSVYALPIIKAILPIPVMDFLCRMLGIAQSSQTMTGRRDSIAFK
jgi:all-trans-retinol dehydrogenase (NAD+)